MSSLTEASGIAASRRNPGVFWTHNDGDRPSLYAIDSNGALLATFRLSQNLADLEDIAVGPGPAGGVSYIYVGDIGGNVGGAVTRSSVKVVRLPEPLVDLSWSQKPLSLDIQQSEAFSLFYPDGSYDAESLMVDPLSGQVLVGTKQDGSTRVYRADLNTATAESTLVLDFLSAVPFGKASAGDISPDGSQIALRREDAAMLWARCDAEPVAAALARAGYSIPVVGPPDEPNGEGLGFLPDGTGYVTISEGANPAIYFFEALCPLPPRFSLSLSNLSVLVGANVEFNAQAAGYPAPVLTWRFNGAALPNQTNSALFLSSVTSSDAGLYEVVASNSAGAVTNSATLTVRPKPDLRITEVQSAEVPSPGLPAADWWELTSFESAPVDLSGWRFNDASGGLADAFVIPAGLTIAPDESVVFVEGLTPAQFRNWWGSQALPSGAKIVTYQGPGLGFSADGDGVRLWNAVAVDNTETVASVNFGPATSGVTFNYDPVAGVFGGLSQLGTNGVSRAAATADIGSPGRILGPLVVPSLSVRLMGGEIRIEFEAQTARTYSLDSRTGLGSGTPWSAAGDILHATNNMTMAFVKPLSPSPRFYRVSGR